MKRMKDMKIDFPVYIFFMLFMSFMVNKKKQMPGA